jgi:hypothetical protein
MVCFVLTFILLTQNKSNKTKRWHESQPQDRFVAQYPASQAIDLTVRSFRARPRTLEHWPKPKTPNQIASTFNQTVPTSGSWQQVVNLALWGQKNVEDF